MDNGRTMKPANLNLPVWGRTSRRPTIFTIGENYEFDEDDDEEAARRRHSSVVYYSSNSSLESDIGETWRSRCNRRLSLPPPSMGLQSWVREESASHPAILKKKKNYEDIKELIKNGKLNEAKGAVRDGDWDFGDEIRSRLWPFLDSMHENNQSHGSYWDSVLELYGDHKDEIPSHPIELPTQCPPQSGLYYKLDETGILICNRVCAVISYAYPDITYCPLLCPLVALFLHYMEEEKAYSCMCNLLSAKNKVFVTQTKIQWDVCAQAALGLTKKFSKSTAASLVRYLKDGDKLEYVFQDWCWWIFRDLPVSHLVRVLDCFLMEGIKVLYRVTIGLLTSFAKCQNPVTVTTDLKEAIANHARTISTTPSRLLKSAFSIRNFRSAEIRRVTTKVQFQVKNEKGIGRTKSNESMPSSRSQVDVCSSSRTLHVREGEKSPPSFHVSGLQSIFCSREQLLTVWAWLPVRVTMYQPELIYTSEEHGCSLTTFFNRVEQHEPTLMLLKVTTGEIFGAYCSTAWATRNEKDNRGERQRYFGTGETFLFSLHPFKARFPWVGIKGKVEHAAELFMHADSNMICIGGGNGTGIQIDAELRFGKSERCLTFDNEPLVEGGDFEISVMEVFGFSVI